MLLLLSVWLQIKLRKLCLPAINGVSVFEVTKTSEYRLCSFFHQTSHLGLGSPFSEKQPVSISKGFTDLFAVLVSWKTPLNFLISISPLLPSKRKHNILSVLPLPNSGQARRWPMQWQSVFARACPPPVAVQSHEELYTRVPNQHNYISKAP